MPVVFWDDNQITIDGSTDLSTSENVRARFEATGWFVNACDGHDYADIARAIDEGIVNRYAAQRAEAEQRHHQSRNDPGRDFPAIKNGQRHQRRHRRQR